MTGFGDKGTVYFLAPVGGGRIKIGWSLSPETRLQHYMGWSPVPLEVLATAPGNRYDERTIHWLFRHQHSHHEWFDPNPELLFLIDAVKESGELPPYARATTKVPFLNCIMRQRKRADASVAA